MWLEAAYAGRVWLWPLYPFGWAFRMLVAFRRWAFKSGLKKSTTFAVPVIIIGNISLGGTGKTPLIIWLAEFLKQQGWRPGIVSRGYGVSITNPIYLNEAHTPAEVGDEACLLRRKTGCPIVVCPNRVAAVRALREQTDINIVLSDDGLQHYALGRTFEIAVIDHERNLGNRQCLPAGPLREPPSRLKTVDAVVLNGTTDAPYHLNLKGSMLENFEGKQIPLSEWKGKSVHACAGIGNPERFFSLLESFGLVLQRHPFPDHHSYKVEELEFGDKLPVVMTEKDAVKCQGFENGNIWFVAVEACVSDSLGYQLLDRLGEANAAG